MLLNSQLGSVTILAMGINNSSIFAKQSDSPRLFDFRNHLQERGFYTELDGEWIFFEKMLLTPNEVTEQLSKKKGIVVSLPSSFQTQTGDINSFGTYSTTIKIPEKYVGETLAIHVPYQYSAYTLFANQGEIARNGIVGENSASHSAEMAPRTGYFIPQSDEVLVTIQVSSFDHIRGGFENSIYIGEASVVSKNFNINMIGTLFMNGCIFIIGLFMILFALYRRQEHLFLIFGLFAMLISARALFAVPFY